MSTGLQTTLEVLSKSRNEAAGTVLLTGLSSATPAICDGVLKPLILRRKKRGHLEILKRWHLFTDAQREILQEGRGRMSGALRDALLSENKQLFHNACEYVEIFCEYDSIPTLVALAENRDHPRAKGATRLIQYLVAQLGEFVHGAENSKDRRDPQAIRRFVLESLERSVERFRRHKRIELVEAFVNLGSHANPLLNTILGDPKHACYLAVINTLTTSPSLGVQELLLTALLGETASPNLLKVISKRDDQPFITRVLAFAKGSLAPQVAKNLSKIRSFAWLQPAWKTYLELADEDQAAAIKLLAASGVKQDAFLDLLEVSLHQGGPLSRLTACEMLSSIQCAQANQLILDTVYDDDPRVQAACVRQLRERHLGGSLPILLQMIDSPHDVVQTAAREALSEFTFANFIAGYESMNDNARRTTAVLVKKVDLQAIPGLLEELASPSPSRRIRGVEIAQLLGAVAEITPTLIELMADKDHVVRCRVAEALQHAPLPAAVAALETALHDQNTTVQDTARASLTALRQSENHNHTPSSPAEAPS